MTTSPPKRREPRLGGAGLKTANPELEYPNRIALQARWRVEASRLLAEWRRSGNPKHRKAFLTHRAAMGARMRMLRSEVQK